MSKELEGKVAIVTGAAHAQHWSTHRGKTG